MPEHALPQWPSLTPGQARQITGDYERFAVQGMPADPAAYIAQTYGLDIAGRYGGRTVKNPFGKASGQLSLHVKQVQADADAGLGFVVLKTVIAQDDSGQQMMHEWAIKETRMQIEPIAGKTTGRVGWTCTWKGRGWHESFESYLKFTGDALAVGREKGMVVAPSVKYHLPGAGETEWKTAEYTYTTQQLLKVWQAAGESGPMILEKDFSPTLAGDDRSAQKLRILDWLRTVPGLVRQAAPGQVILGMKVMNAVFEESFQVELLKALLEAQPAADFWVCFNRLFDPAKEFEGKVGVAYGGPDLSARNLRVLRAFRDSGLKAPSISGTGDVSTGKLAVEYALLGCESLQMHTLFQLPDAHYGGRVGSKSSRALHHLLFHPASGLIPWMLHVKVRTGIDRFLGLQTAPLEALA